MSRPALRRSLYAVLVLAFFLRIDLWLWNDARTLAGLPIGLTYHVGFCVGLSLFLWALVRRAWPADLESTDR